MKPFLISVAAAAVLACSGARSQPPESAVVRDSAGVELVEHPAGAEAKLPNWIAVDSPLVDIGGRDDEPGHDLHLVSAVLHLSDGRIVVANRATQELRVFDSAGTFLSAIGRRGSGPGDFKSIGSLQLLEADSILVTDPQTRRATVFGPDGGVARLISTVRAPGADERAYVNMTGLLHSGRLVGTSMRFPEMKETSGPVRRDSFALVLLSGDSAMDTIAVLPGYELYPALGHEGGHSFPTVRALEFGRSTILSTDGHLIYAGTNETEGIRVYDAAGRLIRIIRGALIAEPVTQEHRDQRMKETLESYAGSQVSEEIKAEWRKNLEDTRYAETFPFYERLMPGTDGSLWVELPRHFADEGRRFVVFNMAGQAIAKVSCPTRMRPFVVGPDRIIGVWRDPDDVQHVRVYPVRAER